MLRRITQLLLILSNLLVFAACTPFPAPRPETPNTVINTYSIILPVTINGKNYKFLLDTGASYTLINNQLASQITQKTPADDIPFIYRQMLAQGIQTTTGVLNENDFILWQPLPIQLDNYSVAAADPWLGKDLSLISESVGQDIDGILGIEIFRQLNWKVNNRDKQITLLQSPPPTLGYQQCVPYNDSYGRSPAMPLDFSDSWAMFNIDTGADYSLISTDALEYLRQKEVPISLVKQGALSISASGIKSDDNYLIDHLVFNNMPLGNFYISENKKGLNSLGMNFLARFDDYLFIPSKMLFCFNSSNFTRNDEKPLRNIALRYYQRNIQIYYNNAADIAEFGLINNDYLRSINDVSVDPADIDGLRQQLSYTQKGGLRLQIERDGKTITIML